MQWTRVVLPTLINASTSSLKMLRIIYTSLNITTYNCTYIRYTISVIATRTTKAVIRMKTARLSQTCCQIHTKYTLEHVYTWFECVFMSYNHLESMSYHYKPAHARPNIGDREHVPRSYNPHIKWYDTHINCFMNLRTSWLSIFERFCRIIFNIHAQAAIEGPDGFTRIHPSIAQLQMGTTNCSPRYKGQV